jgi:Tol biopolymer transport system component
MRIGTLVVATIVGAWVLGLVAGCGSEGPALPDGSLGAAVSADGQKIAYASRRSPAGIWVMLPDGTGKTRVPNTGLEDQFPSWNPDGTKLCFIRGHSGVYIINADGTAFRSVHDGYGQEWHPRWRPTGGKIVFSQPRTVTETDICVVSVSGTGFTALTPPGTGHNGDPAWSPDGTRIVFNSTRAGGYGIYTMDANGGSVKRLSPPGVSDCRPAWSPNGTRIAFSRGPAGNSEIWTMGAATGGNPKQLTYDGSWALDPEWSPGGLKIAFASTRDGGDDMEIWVMGAGGGGLTRLTSNSAFDGQPSWWAP